MQKREFPALCLGCFSRDCENSLSGTFDVCKYGIAFFNNGVKIDRKEPLLPIAKISKNLRHEINPVLQTIIDQVTQLNPKLSTKEIDINDPLSVVIGATVILDIFIQMITGVNEFHYSSEPISQLRKVFNVHNLVENYYNIYSILKEKERSKNLKLVNLVNKQLTINVCADFINYIIAVLIDNAWKYSTETSVLNVSSSNVKERLSTDSHNGTYKKIKTVDLILTNHSLRLPDNLPIYELGAKANSDSKGFGFGLYWAKNLEFHYNDLINELPGEQDRFQILHEQLGASDPQFAYQKFTLKNVIIDRYEI
jgi:hypothetical protein